MLDMTGAAGVNLENLQLVTPANADFTAWNNDIVPYTAILLGQNASWAGNAIQISNVSILGLFSVASIYCYGFQSSSIINSNFFNFYPGDSPVLAFTKFNYAKVTSRFTQMINVPVTTSDWTLVACEIHSFAAQFGGVAKAPAVILDGTEQMRWYGGNISGSGPEYVRLSNDPKWTVFSGTTLYSDNGTPTRAAFRSADKVSGLSVDQCHLHAETVFAGAETTIYANLNLTGSLEMPYRVEPNAAGPHVPQRVVDCPGGIVTDSSIQCSGRGVRADTISATLLVNPGEVAARVDGAVRVSRDAFDRTRGIGAPSRTVKVENDRVAAITGLPAGGVLLVTFQAVDPGDNARWGQLGFQTGSPTVTLGGGKDWQHLPASATAPDVNRVARDRLGFQASTRQPGTLFVVNRLGKTREIRIYPFSVDLK